MSEKYIVHIKGENLIDDGRFECITQEETIHYVTKCIEQGYKEINIKRKDK